MAKSGADRAVAALLSAFPWWMWAAVAAVVAIYSIGGWPLLIAMGFAAIVWVAISRFAAAERENAQELIRRMARSALPPREARALNRQLMSESHRIAEVVRKVQIMRESVDIAMKSKNRDTVESRLATVASMRGAIRGYQGVCDEETNKVLDWLADDEVSAAWTAYYLNAARQARDKAMTLKTDKSRSKYDQLARSLLEEGLAHPMTRKRQIEELMNRLS